MSGHSRWAQIKHKKAISDARRGQLFSKIIRLISAAAASKGTDPATNPTLRAAIDKAREINMPQENIERAIKKAEGTRGDEFTFEAYGPGGVALVITGITDNMNRSSNEIKHILAEHNAKLATPGSVLWAFEKKDSDWVPKPYAEITLVESDTKNLYQLMEALDEHDDVQEIYANNREP